MNKMTIFLLIIIMALSFSLGMTIQSKAQDKSYASIVPFVTNNRVGFFDQSYGRFYVYDSNIANCVFVGQIDSLGQPISVVSSNPANNFYQ
jgi:hypothetical protein